MKTLNGKFGNKNMQDLETKKILVTGGTGFIGSHFVEKLLKHNPKSIVCLYRSSNPKSYFSTQKLVDEVILANCDLKNFKRVNDVLNKYEIDTIFHFGAQAIVDTAYKNPLETIETNVMGTTNLLEACRQKGDTRAIVVVTSDKAYGKAENLPYKEQMPLKGDHPYEVSKSSADLIARTYYKTYNLPVTVARFGNVFGPGDINFNRIVPGIFKAIINNEEFLIRSDGQMIRDYVYVKDVINGPIQMAKNIEKSRGEAFNFGSKNIFSVIEVVKKIEGILKVKVNYRILNIAKNEIPKQYLDWRKAKRMLSWQPRYSFEQGIKESFDWYKNCFREK